MVVQYEGVREQETLLVHVQSSFPALDALWKDMHAAHVHAACSYVHDRCIQCTYIIDAYVAICHVYCTCISSLVARARMKQNEARTKPRTSNQHNERKAQRKAQTQPQLSQPKSAPSNLLVVTSTRFPDHDHGSCCSRHKFLFAPTSVDGERQARAPYLSRSIIPGSTPKRQGPARKGKERARATASGRAGYARTGSCLPTPPRVGLSV